MPRVGNKHYPYTPEGRAAAARDKRGRGLTATEGFDRPGQLDDAAGRAMYKKGGDVGDFRRLIKKSGKKDSKATKEKSGSKVLERARARTQAMKKGGKVQGYDSRLDESLGVRHGKKKEQKYKDRRDESRAMAKKGRSKASKRGDGVARQGHTKGRLV
mgnify:CR=1 FL=1